MARSASLLVKGTLKSYIKASTAACPLSNRSKRFFDLLCLIRPFFFFMGGGSGGFYANPMSRMVLYFASYPAIRSGSICAKLALIRSSFFFLMSYSKSIICCPHGCRSFSSTATNSGDGVRCTKHGCTDRIFHTRVIHHAWTPPYSSTIYFPHPSRLSHVWYERNSRSAQAYRPYGATATFRTEAAYGCLEPVPTNRLRRTYLHLGYSIVLTEHVLGTSHPWLHEHSAIPAPCHPWRRSNLERPVRVMASA